MFALTTLVYPCLLAALCLGAGLLVDRLSGRFLPAVLLPAVGAATLIGVSQLTTYRASSAPATPYVMVAVGALGFLVGAGRLRRAAACLRRGDERLWLPLVAYFVALAPVLLAGRTTFPAYGVLTDSAFHMMGADFLIRHGQDYAHLNLQSSYGQYIYHYYATGYPSGADTLFGGSAFILGLPLIWAFQPFNAFMLAIAVGPLWLLIRRTGLPGSWTALATLTATVPALVYAYELIASVKEITALPLVLTLGALVVLNERWLRGAPRAALPFALVAAGGVSALGVGFGAWIGASAIVLAGVLASNFALGRQRVLRSGLLIAAGLLVTFVAALPTMLHLSASLQTTQAISSTASAGNLQTPLQIAQAVGTWLTGLYTNAPSGTASVITYVVIAVTVVAAVLGLARLLALREHALLWWLVAMVLVGCVLTILSTSWIDAKALMLSSPIIMLLAWAGVAALLDHHILRFVGLVVAIALAGGVLASDVLQYNATDLAPTARYTELASIGTRFSGRGPALFTDFDEYALYELRGLEVGGPDFLFPPPALSRFAQPHGYPVNLDKVAPRKLLAYPLIVTRVDPLASRPPAAYRLLWQGTYYQVWGRRHNAAPALEHLGLSANRVVKCARVERLARVASLASGRLVAAVPPGIVSVTFGSRQPGYVDRGLNLTPRVAVDFRVPRSGRWDIWLRGEVMPAVTVSVDGRKLATISDQLAGNQFNPDTLNPIEVMLPHGRHRLSFRASGSILAPGDGGTARLGRVFLTPTRDARAEFLVTVPADHWRSLCGRRLDWIEAVRGRRHRRRH
jgi:hypothetical protein